MPGVVFNPAAKAHLLHHFQVEFRAHLDPLGFKILSVRFKPFDPVIEFLPNGLERPLHFVVRGHELLGRIEDESVEFFQAFGR